MRREQTILLIIPNLDFGGAQESFSKLSLLLSKEYRVINIVFNTTQMANYELGGSLCSLDVPGANNWGLKIFNFINRVRKVRKLKAKNNISISISFLEGADYINILSRMGEKVILSIRGSKKYDQNISGLLGWLRHKVMIPYFYNRADLLITLCQGIKTELQSHYELKTSIKVIYNAYDRDLIQSKINEPIDEKELAIFDKPVLVSHGRLAIEKGYDHLIDVFSEVHKKIDCRLLLIGDGCEKKNLQDQCGKLNLDFQELNGASTVLSNTSVVFLGYKQNPYKYLSKSKFFLFSSIHEGFGNSIVEAMSCGLPIIASDCAYGPREILKMSVDTSINLSYPYFAEFGVLLPPIDTSLECKNIWIDFLIDSFSNNRISSYSKLGIDRVADFDPSRNRDSWMEAVQRLLKIDECS